MIRVGPFDVVDETRDEVVDRIVAAASTRCGAVVVGLHVAALNHRHDEHFVRAARDADIVFADGAAVVLLARVAGARHIERSPTTDIGHDVIRRLSARLGRPAKLALVGGPEGLAREAATELARLHRCDIVLAKAGYGLDLPELAEEVRGSAADLLLLGLGLPLETVIASEIAGTAGCAIYGVGGWFGHVLGRESRAPKVLRQLGLEWTWRLAQQPRRLAARYAKGALSTAALIPAALVGRSSARTRP